MALPIDLSSMDRAAEFAVNSKEADQRNDLAQRAMAMREEAHPLEMAEKKMGNLGMELQLNQKRREEEKAAQKSKAMGTDFNAEDLIGQLSQSAPETGKMLLTMAEDIGLFGTLDIGGKKVRTLNGQKLQMFNELINQDVGIQKSMSDAQWQDLQSTKARITQEMTALQGKNSPKDQEKIAQLQKVFQATTAMETQLIGRSKELQEKMSVEEAKIKASIIKEAAIENIKQPNREKLKRLEATSGLDPETVNTEAIKYMVTGTMPPLGMGSKEARADIMNAKSRIMKEKGYDENTVLTMQRKYAATGKSYDRQVASRDTMESFVTNIGEQSDKISTLMKELQRTDARLLNVPLVEAKKKIKGSGQEQVLNMLLTEISTEASKIAAGAQQSIAEPSVQAQERWNKIHDGTLPIKDLKHVIDMTVELANTRLGTVNRTLSRTEEDMQKMVTGVSGGGKQRVANAAKTIVRSGTYNGRKVVQYSDGTTDYAD